MSSPPDCPADRATTHAPAVREASVPAAPGDDADFDAVTAALLTLLGAPAPMLTWVIAARAQRHWIALATHGGSHGPQRGDSLPWDESLCARMVDGAGPRIAQRIDEHPAYATAAMTALYRLRGYLGHPVHLPDGDLFGSVCAFSRAPLAPQTGLWLPRLHAAAILLETHLRQQAQLSSAQRRAENAQRESRLDPLTGLLNRRGWSLAVAAEQARLQRSGGTTVVLMIDIVGLKQINDARGHAAGDTLIKRCASALASQIRPFDSLARLGGDEFGLLLSGNMRPDAAKAVIERMQDALRQAQVQAHIGYGLATSGRAIEDAIHEADRHLLLSKQGH